MNSSPYIWDPNSSVSLTFKPRVPNRQTTVRYDPCIARWADDGGQMHDRSHVYNAGYLAPIRSAPWTIGNGADPALSGPWRHAVDDTMTRAFIAISLLALMIIAFAVL